MSLGQFVLVGNWLLEGRYREKLLRLQTNKSAFFILSFFFLHLIGLLWSEDSSYAFKDIRIKLVLFVLPFVLASTRPLSSRQLKNLLHFFVLSVFVVSIFSWGKLFGISGKAIYDKRQLAINISHIRYGLMVAFSLLICTFYALKDKQNQWPYIIACIYFFSCLLMFQLYTGLLIFALVSCGFLLRNLFAEQLSIFMKFWSALILFLVIALPAYVINSVYSDFYEVPKELDYEQDDLMSKTASGNKYHHYLDMPQKENGYYVWRFINYDELKREWNKRSGIAFDSVDKKGQQLDYTLIRYLTSLGLKKDSVGLSKLSNKDVSAIESGIANVYLVENNKIKSRIHSTLYELKNYRKYDIAEGFSIAMRLEYWKTALEIISRNFVFGVGTGDIQNTFNLEYQKETSLLRNEDYWRRSHNQYLSTWVQLGIPGLLLLLLMLFYPIFQRGTLNNFLFVAFIALMSFSMLTEDTLETQTGATLFSLFYSLFLFSPRP